MKNFKKLICIILSLALALAIIPTSLFASAKTEQMNIYGLYLTREGDATLIESNGEWLLIDTGLADTSAELLKKLKDYNISELSVLLSHMHIDHVGAFDDICESSEFKINALYLPKPDLTSDWTTNRYTRAKNAALSNNPFASVSYLDKGDTFSFGSVSAKVLGPAGNISRSDFVPSPDDNPSEDHYVNCRSLTVRFDSCGVSFLSGGDIEKEEELALIKEYEKTGELDCDILKLSHHALPTSNCEEFLKAVSPKYSFALNSNKIKAADSNYRLYYNSCKNAAKYGPVYLVGDEKLDFKAEAVNGKVNIYKGTTKLSGMVSLTGGDGTKVKNNLYYITDSELSDGVYTVSGKKYYISDGQVAMPFYSFNNSKYINQLTFSDGTRYFELDGSLVTGFKKIGDYTYFFDSTTGLKKLGTENWDITVINGKKYAINQNGVIYNASYKGGWKKYSSGLRYFDKDGVMKTGWFTLGGKKYYLDPSTGFRTVGLKKINGKTYYFVETNSAAYAYTGGWKKFGKNYRYFDKNGVMKTGWLTVSGKKYYLDTKTGFRTVGLKKISGKTYYFTETNSAAYAYTGGWKKFGKNYRYFDKKGVMKTGWLKVKGKYYYLNTKTGYRTVGLKKIKGKTYYFVEKNSAAYRYSGWKKFGKKMRYFDKNGVMAVGKKKIGGKTYKFDKNGYRK